MQLRTRLAAPALLALLVLAGCTPGAANPGSGPGTSGAAPGAGSSALNCSGAKTDGYDLFVDPAITIDPQNSVYSLAAGDSIGFTYSKHDDGRYPQYDWTSSYIQPSDGSVFDNDASFFFDAADGKFQLDGPQAPSGIDGGPYAGFITIGVTQDEASNGDAYDAARIVLARICVVFATSQ
ncbi:MAG: hypothetical protein ABIR17_12715 [Pseudolysinimonas sp.]|uniref:hypothetical protein n=1 Tax=Pseudolysinimonas sp. TaxID=2680009 RepID=UPI0032637B31